MSRAVAALVLVTLMPGATAIAGAPRGAWEVSEEVRLDASVDDVRDVVLDLRRWPEWTEWAPLHATGAWSVVGTARASGQTATWVGSPTPSGQLRWTGLDDRGVARFELVMDGAPPALGSFVIAGDDAHTTVVWSVVGPVPDARWRSGARHARAVSDAWRVALAGLERRMHAEQVARAALARQRAVAAEAAERAVRLAEERERAPADAAP